MLFSGKRLFLLFLGIFLCAAVVVLFRLKEHQSNRADFEKEAEIENPDAPTAVESVSERAASRLPGPGKAGLDGELLAEIDYYSQSLMETNAVYRERVKKHLRLKYYYDSPARNTPECQKIQKLLADRGIGLDAVPEAYNAVWDYAAEKLARETTYPNSSENEILFRMLRDTAVSRFSQKYGVADGEFYDAIFSLRPTVFFGRYIGAVQPGEKLLAE